MTPSRRGLWIAAGGLPLALLPALASPSLWPAWVLFWALLLALFGLDAALLARGGQVTAALDPPALLFVGDSRAAHPLRLRLDVPHLRRPAEALVGLDLSDTLAPAPPQRARIGPGAPPVEIPLRPLRRGPAVIQAAWVRYLGPLGLVQRTARVPLDAPLRAVVDAPAVRAAALRFLSERERTSGIKIERFLGDGTEFDALREFLPGHDRRSLDWKASARHTKLLAREHRAERSHQVVLAVDTGRLMAEPLGALPRLDHAIHAALLLASVSVRAGDRVSLYAFDERPRCFLPPRGGAAGLRAVLQQSGELAYSTAETNFTLGLTELLGRLTRRSLVIVLTDFVDTVTAELMVENVTRLARRHLCVFVALRDPLFAELCAAPPAAMLDVHRAVVADALLLDREVVLKRLGRRGVFCIDAPPDQAGPELLRRYLEIKRREMI